MATLSREIANTDEGIRFLKDLQSGKRIFRAYGIYGEIPGSDAYVDEVIKPEEGGTFLKLYGCSYLFRGNPDSIRVHGIELAKSLIFNFPKLMAHSYLFAIAIALQLIFYKRKLLERIDWIMSEIDHKVVRHLDIKENEYNAPVKEVKRAIAISLKEEFDIDLTKPYYPVDHARFKRDRVLPDPDDNKWDKNFLGYLIARASKFICLFLETDNAYRFRVQDSFGLVKKTLDGDKEFIRILDILISRETESGVPNKWRMIKTGSKIAFFFIPKLKRFMTRFLNNLDTSKVEMDDADWFYCLTYHSYNFSGFSKKERYATRKAINEEKGHVWLVGYPVYE
jgi:hypothetical protein